MKAEASVIYMYGYPGNRRELIKTLEICFVCDLYYMEIIGIYEEG
jgi:hypothetical protein